MKKMIVRAAALFFTAAALISVSAMAEPVVSARSAIVMDAQTGRVLWSQRSEEKSLIASTTKIMTGLLVAEECELQARVCVGKEAVGVEGSSVYLKEGEILTVEALLYGMMLHSGNDAAVALAMFCGGSQENFVNKMNLKAEELGLENTKFANPHGLDSGENYSTAYDMAKLTAYAMNNSTFARIVSTRTVTFGERVFTNHNKLLWRYQGVIGVKTGYTMAAGRILVSCAERDGRRLIAVTISDPNDWKDHCAMLDYGFDAYDNTVVAAADTFCVNVPVIGGSEEFCCVVLHEDVIYPLLKDSQVTLHCSLPEFVYAPVLAGDKAGEIQIFVDGVQIGSADLYWRNSVLEGA